MKIFNYDEFRINESKDHDTEVYNRIKSYSKDIYSEIMRLSDEYEVIVSDDNDYFPGSWKVQIQRYEETGDQGLYVGYSTNNDGYYYASTHVNDEPGGIVYHKSVVGKNSFTETEMLDFIKTI